MNTKEKILHYSRGRFMKEGFSNIPMDEIAADLQISKKTIYKHFDSKNELVKQVAFNFAKDQAVIIDKMLEQNLDALTKLNRLLTLIGEALIQLSQNWLRDMRNSLPEVWKEIDEFRTKLVTERFSKIIYQAQQEGMMEPFPIELVLRLFIAGISAVVNPEYMMRSPLPPKELFQQTITFYINGLLTEKGKKKFKKLKAGA